MSRREYPLASYGEVVPRVVRMPDGTFERRWTIIFDEALSEHEVDFTVAHEVARYYFTEIAPRSHTEADADALAAELLNGEVLS